MKKGEASQLLTQISPLIQQVEEEQLPFLEKRLTEEGLVQRESQFEQWRNQLPDVLKNNVLVDEETFSPSFFHRNSEEVKSILSSLLQGLKRMKIYKEVSLPLVKEGVIHLQKLVDYDTNVFFRLFQSKEVKQQVREANQFLAVHEKELRNLEVSYKNWNEISSDNKEVRELTLTDRKKLLKYIRQDAFVEEGKEPLVVYCSEKVDEMFSYVTINSKQQVEQEMRESWQKLIQQQIDTELQRVPVTMLRDESGELLNFIEKLTDDFPFVQDIVKQKNIRWERYGLSDFEVEKLQKSIRIIVEKTTERAYPRLQIGKLGSLERQLLEIVYVYRTYSKQRESDEKQLLQQGEKWKGLEKEFFHLAENRHDADIFLEDDQYEEWTKKESQLYTQYTLIHSNIERFAPLDLRNHRNAVVERDYRENAAEYYAIIENIIGTKREYKPSDLPSIIVEEVSAVELNQEKMEVTLRPYQEFGAKYVLYNQNVLLGDEMGLGKTIQALSVANHLYRSGKRKVFIVCPLSVLENWYREIKKWTYLPVFRYCSSNKERQVEYKKWEQEGGVLLANYEQCKKILELNEVPDIDFMIVDEAHNIKNPNAIKTKTTLHLALNATYKLFMTGTPLENRVQEMQHLLKVLKPNLPKSLFKEQPNEEEFKQFIATVYLRRKRQEVLNELPELEMVELWSRYSKEQEEWYDDAVLSEGVSVMELRRMAFKGEESEKIKQIKEICEQARGNGEKVLLFSFFKTDVLYRLQEELSYTARGILSGDVSPSKRQEIIDEFSKSDSQTVLLSQIDAGGVGLNIQCASIVILCEPQWKPSTEQQAISRAYRMGQTRNVIVYRLLTEESIDEQMMKILHRKEDEFNRYAQDSVVSDAFFRQKDLSEKELQSQILELERQRVRAKLKNAS